MWYIVEKKKYTHIFACIKNFHQKKKQFRTDIFSLCDKAYFGKENTSMNIFCPFHFNEFFALTQFRRLSASDLQIWKGESFKQKLHYWINGKCRLICTFLSCEKNLHCEKQLAKLLRWLSFYNLKWTIGKERLECEKIGR